MVEPRSERLQVVIPLGAVNRLKDKARQEGRTVSALMRKILCDAVAYEQLNLNEQLVKIDEVYLALDTPAKDA